ncbi:MAG: RagB/SusD family nutrient uptake outer membrane protein [Ginsengibacter sp.]
MKINKINKCLFAWSLGLLAAVSCTKLQTNVYSVVPSTSYWQTPAQVAAGVAPAYSTLNGVQTIGGDIANMIEGTSDEMLVLTRGNDWGDVGHWDALWYHSYEPTNSNWNNGWNDVFGGISKCNLIIQSVNALSPAPPTLPSIIAQVKTIRAYYYYLAMSVFGNVPIVTDTTTTSAPPTATRADVYNFIVADLNASLPNLTTEVDPSTYGQVTKYFAHTLLARLYLNAQVFTGVPGPSYTAGTANYPSAINECDSVMAGPYSLMSDYFDNFMPNNGPGSTENIYAYPCDHINNKSNDWENAVLHYQSYLALGMASGANLWNGFSSQADFYNTFDTTSTYAQSGDKTLRSYKDMRSGQWLIGQQYIGTYNYPPSQNVIVSGPASDMVIDAGTSAPLAFNPNFTLFSDASPAGRLAGVRNIKYFPSPSSGQNGADMDNDFVIFRLAEIYFIKAEAELRLGQNTDDALSLINKIRERAYGDASHDITSSQLTLQFILDEKGREMAYEGVRRDDLIRYEVAGNGPYFTKARTVGGKAADPNQHWMVFPIPSLQITANSNLKQNNGY